ncbi:MAG: hypothetical protein LBM19_00430 [Holosporales bacterium]|jgi:hypothetical protein|nr:hypothetical protein [Holosporales bacterium]
MNTNRKSKYTVGKLMMQAVAAVMFFQASSIETVAMQDPNWDMRDGCCGGKCRDCGRSLTRGATWVRGLVQHPLEFVAGGIFTGAVGFFTGGLPGVIIALSGAPLGELGGRLHDKYSGRVATPQPEKMGLLDNASVADMSDRRAIFRGIASKKKRLDTVLRAYVGIPRRSVLSASLKRFDNLVIRKAHSEDIISEYNNILGIVKGMAVRDSSQACYATWAFLNLEDAIYELGIEV